MRRRWCTFFVLVLVASCFERGGHDATRRAEDVAPSKERPAVPPSAAETVDASATVRIALESEPGHLNPLFADAIAYRLALGDIYQGLLCQDQTTVAPQPCLAERMRASEGGTVYEFWLREATWHDGKPVTAADARYTFELLGPAGRIPTALRFAYDDLVKVEAEGRKLVLQFREYRPDRLESIAATPILPGHEFRPLSGAELAAALATKKPVGTGPLRFRNWTPGREIVLVRWDNYWGEPSAAARVEYRLVTSRAQAKSMLAAGRIDVVSQVPFDDASAASRADAKMFTYSAAAYLAIVLNTKHEKLRDRATRLALSRSLDRRAIATAIFGGYARPIRGPMLSSVYEPGPIRRNEISAALKKSGLGSLELVVPASSSTGARIADIWAADVRPTIDLKIRRAPFDEVLKRLASGDFDMVLMSFSTSAQVDLYSRFHSSAAYGGFADARVDELLARLRSEVEEEARTAMTADLQRALDDSVPYIFVVEDVRAGIARPFIRGLDRAGLYSYGRFVGKAQHAVE
jgi:ABC-type transport system substrate-binding protein